MLVRIGKCEWAAVLLIAFLIWGPLAVKVFKEPTIMYQQIFDVATLAVLVVQAWILHNQRRLMKRQATIADKQTDIQKAQHFATHRPKLRVRNVVITSGNFREGDVFGGQFFVENLGGSKATIVESHCEFLWNVAGLPMERPYEGKTGNNPITKGTVVAANIAVVGLLEYNFETLSSGVRQRGPNDGDRIFFLGWIDYTDEGVTRRRKAFCREYKRRDEGSNRFWPVENDPDYENEG